MKYRLISNDTIKNLIDFLDEIQFEAAKVNSTDAHHQVNFCNWAINELLNSYNVMTASDLKGGKGKPKKKTRQDYVDETFIDWNLPEMTDEEYEKLVDQFDAFLRGWEKEYYKKNPKDKSKKRKPKFRPPHIDDVAQYMSLEEINILRNTTDKNMVDNIGNAPAHDRIQAMGTFEELRAIQAEMYDRCDIEYWMMDLINDDYERIEEAVKDKVVFFDASNIFGYHINHAFNTLDKLVDSYYKLHEVLSQSKQCWFQGTKPTKQWERQWIS